MSFAHLARLRSRGGDVSRDPVPAMAEALAGVLMLHREIMAERDQTQRLTREVGGLQQALAELRCYSELLERELDRMRHERRPDVDGWR